MSNLQRKNKLARLIDGSPESWYWIGFIMADGHINLKNRMVVTSAIKDLDHIKKLARFLEVKYSTYFNLKGYSSNGEFARISVMDTTSISKIREQFNLSSRKTYNPPKLDFLNAEQLFCFSIGFIDGDGCISFQTGRTDVSVRIKCHESWADNLKLMYDNSKINSKGYAISSITNNTKIREIKSKALDLNLPIMNRKWVKIDLDRASGYVVAKQRLEILKVRLKEGVKKKLIAEELGISCSGISQLIKRNKL